MNVHELLYLICVVLMFRFSDQKHRDTDVDSSISVGLNRSPFTAELVHKQLTVLS